jgi:hypothetical protein
MAVQNKTSNTQDVPQKVERKLSKINSVEIDLYKKLYENSADSNSKLIGTIQWSIGIILTFLAVLLGSQIFFNYKVSKEEVKAIRSELEEKFTEFKSDIYKAIETERRALTDELEDKVSKIESRFKDGISEQLGEKGKYIDVNIKSFEKEIDSFKDSSKRELGFLRINVSKLEGEVWKLRGVNSNALSRFIGCVNMEIETGLNPRHSLDDIIEALQNVSDISKGDFDELGKMLAQIPSEHSEKKSKIEEISSTLKQFIFVEDPSRPGYLKTVNI